MAGTRQNVDGRKLAEGDTPAKPCFQQVWGQSWYLPSGNNLSAKLGDRNSYRSQTEVTAANLCVCSLWHVCVCVSEIPGVNTGRKEKKKEKKQRGFREQDQSSAVPNPGNRGGSIPVMYCELALLIHWDCFSISGKTEPGQGWGKNNALRFCIEKAKLINSSKSNHCGRF